MEIIKDPKIIAALELLNVSAKEKKEDVAKAVSSKYTHLRDALINDGKNVVTDNPWLVAGGIALSAVTVGLSYFLIKKMTE